MRSCETGSGDTVVVLHGAGGPPADTPALDRIAETFRVVRVEMTGWDGEPADHLASLADYAGEVASLINALSVGPVHVIGSSIGGAVALHLALDHPDTVMSLVLEGPAAFRVGARPPFELSPEEFVAAFRRHPEKEPHMAPPDPAVMGRVGPIIGRVLVATPDYDEGVVERMRSCTVPTLVLIGEHDGIVPADNGKTYEHLPNGTFRAIEDAAHDIQADQPEVFVNAVTEFFQRARRPDTAS